MKLEDLHKTFEYIFNESGKVIVGQKEVLKQITVALLADSHALLEGYPGLAKTLAVKTMAELMDLKFSRIQNTPDLMPSDITGTYIIEEVSGKRSFKFQQGPIFANIVLADEINRATPKTQSALLEAMQERQVTIGNSTFKLDLPFFVLATQNPIEQEGTYPLPEAQSDRFLLKIKVGYPSFDEEVEIVNRFAEHKKVHKLKHALNKDSLLYLQELTKQIPIANDLKKYAVGIVAKTRNKKDLIEFGASPRASIGLILAAKAHALIEGRKHVSKKDIDEMAFPVLRHRLILSFEAERQGLSEDDVISKIIK
ncbi:AAA family ATPase [Candidatus Woesearchaeota archaeon ex4484_78]|nr:MAG: AAA family ATPase [Candidatus Woesearchaeota archaeon ex4484_78]